MVRPRPFLSLVGLALMIPTGGIGCAAKVRGDAAIPHAALYRREADFSGTWEGYIAEHYGVLILERLRQGVYGGNFIGEEESVQFALMARQDQMRVHKRAPVRGGNRLIFEWQDGGNSEGRGWLLVSREGSALTGEFGFAEAAIGGGLWNFVRSDESAPQ